MDRKRSHQSEKNGVLVKKAKKNESVSILKFFKMIEPQPDACTTLLNHDMKKHILYHDGKFRILYEHAGYKTVGGIIPFIRSKFYPYYEHYAGWTPKEFASSLSLGERVHRHIHHIYTCDVTGKCDCEKKTNIKKINGLARIAQRFLCDFEITPRGTEIPIVSLKAGKCTKIDMIGERWSGKENKISVLISWKTGYCSDYDKNKKGTMMRQPLEDYISTPQHHNHIQSIIEYKIVEEEYGIKFDQYIIVYLGHKGKNTYDNEYLKDQDLFKKMSGKIYDVFCAN